MDTTPVESRTILVLTEHVVSSLLAVSISFLPFSTLWPLCCNGIGMFHICVFAEPGEKDKEKEKPKEKVAKLVKSEESKITKKAEQK